MTHLIKLATGKLNDPILIDWALDRYRQTSKGHSHRQEEMEQAWFDELTLRRWLNSDDQEARGLLGHSVYRREQRGGTCRPKQDPDYGGGTLRQTAVTGG